MKIFGWAADQAGCGYYRVRLPLQALADYGGHQTEISTRLPTTWRDEADVIVGQRICLPGPSGIWQRLAREGRFLVLEIDDDLFEVHHSSIAYQFWSDPTIRQNLRDNIAAASRVTCTTHELADRLRRFNSNVCVVPNAVPGWLLGPPTPAIPSQAAPVDGRVPDDTLTTIGWAGSPTHAADWQDLAGPLRRLIDRHPGVELHLMGWAPVELADRIGDPSTRRRFTPWHEPVPEYLKLIDFDIALAPLRPSVFNRCKSDLKFIEMAALGIPTIATRTGPYAETVDHGSTGYLYDQPHQAMMLLRALVGDPAHRAEIGRAAREYARTRTIEEVWPQWEKALTPGA
jgi:glycosyltransferase involved in cell wall biosynthesis